MAHLQGIEALYSLDIAVSIFLPSGEEMMERSGEGSWVEGTAGTKAWRLELGPSQEKRGVGFELERGERIRSQLLCTRAK